MADMKRRVLTLSTGKQIKLFGSSVAISKSKEIGEGYAPNIFSAAPENSAEKSTGKVSNPYQLTPAELHELADYNIQLWMELKAAIRKYGIEHSKIFSLDQTH